MKKQEEKFKEWEYSPGGINPYAFDVAGHLLPKYARMPLIKALSPLPKKILDFVIDNCIFMSLEAGNQGEWYNFNHPFFKGKKGIILLADSLWKASPIERALIIAHEVAHAFRGHSIIITEMSDVQEHGELEIEIKKMIEEMEMEKKQMEMDDEADRLAIKWLVKYYDKESLLEICNKRAKKRGAREKSLID